VYDKAPPIASDREDRSGLLDGIHWAIDYGRAGDSSTAAGFDFVRLRHITATAMAMATPPSNTHTMARRDGPPDGASSTLVGDVASGAGTRAGGTSTLSNDANTLVAV
jgi:hypothetical protein